MTHLCLGTAAGHEQTGSQSTAGGSSLTVRPSARLICGTHAKGMPTPLRDPGEPEAKLSLWFQGVFRPQRVLVQEQKSIQKETNCHRSVYSINSTHTQHTLIHVLGEGRPKNQNIQNQNNQRSERGGFKKGSGNLVFAGGFFPPPPAVLADPSLSPSQS